MDDRYRELVELARAMVLALVDHTEDVHLNVITGASNILLEVTISAADMGHLIGQKGRNADAIRTILNAATKKHGINNCSFTILPRGRAPRHD